MQHGRFVNDPNAKEKCMDSVKTKYIGYNENRSLKWDALTEVLVKSATKIIAKKKKILKKCMTDEILNMMKQCQKIRAKTGTKFRTLHKESTNKWHGSVERNRPKINVQKYKEKADVF